MVETIALIATQGFEELYPILSYDGANTLYSIYYKTVLPGESEIVPSEVPYTANLYGREPLKHLFTLDGRGLNVIESARGGRTLSLKPGLP